ncbi:MAG: PstS family phosphate ABC transporter substrate-binding protein [Bacteroidia bacterium]|nr:PstS family phosphate ABC transporter substrate-binding protein [Bacteroidia bacterium]MDW8134658.1 PstS family phosphate ABC transporter substrate-binding protein [Bacteroidia bacterium]
MRFLWSALFFLGGCARRELITIRGSDTVLPLSQTFAEAFMSQGRDVLVSVTGGGSGVGIAALLRRDTDIAMSSRPLKLGERLKFAAAGRAIREDTVGWDVLAICVHPSNPVQRISRAQIADIYTGRIRNWKDLGGPDMPILPYSRESSSGTFEFFREYILKGGDFAPHVRFIPATGMLVQSLSQTAGAIGYVGIAYVNPQVKVLAVAQDGDTIYFYPARSRSELQRYPIARPLLYYYENPSKRGVEEFLRFVHSEEGRAIVSRVGYVP